MLSKAFVVKLKRVSTFALLAAIIWSLVKFMKILL